MLLLNSKVRRPRIGDRPFTTELMFDHADDGGSATPRPSIMYQLHASGSFS